MKAAPLFTAKMPEMVRLLPEWVKLPPLAMVRDWPALMVTVPLVLVSEPLMVALVLFWTKFPKVTARVFPVFTAIVPLLVKVFMLIDAL